MIRRETRRKGESGEVESERSSEVSRRGLVAWVGMSEEEKKRFETRRSVEGSREKKEKKRSEDVVVDRERFGGGGGGEGEVVER